MNCLWVPNSEGAFWCLCGKCCQGVGTRRGVGTSAFLQAPCCNQSHSPLCYGMPPMAGERWQAADGELTSSQHLLGLMPLILDLFLHPHCAAGGVFSVLALPFSNPFLPLGAHWALKVTKFTAPQACLECTVSVAVRSLC